MTERRLPFDGPMMIGGMPYELDEVSAGFSRPRITTGFQALDEATDGIGRGEVWAVVGPSGIGVSALCSAIASAASLEEEVVLCNGHIPSQLMVATLRALGAAESLTLSSWLGSTREAPPDGAPGRARPTLTIIDTWDETLAPGLEARTYTGVVDELRQIRRNAGRSWTALVLSARLPGAEGGERLGSFDGALKEVAHVWIELRRVDSKSYLFVGPRGRPSKWLRFCQRDGKVRVLEDVDDQPLW